MSNEEYINYTLKNLEESVREALESEATPKEVYETIINEIERTANYHRACLNTSAKTLSLFEDNIEVNDSYDDFENPNPPQNVVSFNAVSRKINEAKNESEWKDFFKPSMDEFSSAEEGSEWVKKNGGYEYTPEIKVDDPNTWPDYTELPDLTKDITINTTDGDTTHTVKLPELTKDMTINTTPDGVA